MKTATMLKLELKNVEIKGVTIQFDFNEKLPQPLLKKIIKARKKEVDEILNSNKKRINTIGLTLKIYHDYIIEI